MSTHSFICIEDGDSFKAICCHFNGYPDGVGVTLRDHFQSRDKIEQLLALGEISGLDARLEYCGVIENGNIQSFNSIMELLEAANDSNIEYVYLFTDTGQWLWYDVFDDNSQWRNL